MPRSRTVIPQVVLAAALVAACCSCVSKGHGPEVTTDGAPPTDAEPAKQCQPGDPSVLVAPGSCRPTVCMRPTIGLAARDEGFLVVYPVNTVWWSAVLWGQLLDPSGALLGEPIDISGQTDPYLGRPPRGPASFPAALSIGSNWLVVWEQVVAFVPAVFASLLDSTGMPVWNGNVGLSGSTWVGVNLVAPDVLGSYDQYASSVAGTRVDDRAVLAWWGVKDGLQNPTDNVCIGAMRSDGVRVRPDLDVTTESAQVASGPAIASSGDSMLVVWSDRRTADASDNAPPGVESDIWARVITSDTTGYVFKTDEFHIAPARWRSESPRVVWGGDAFVVAWQDYRTGYDAIYTVQVTEDGQVDPPDGQRITGLAMSQAPALASSEGQVLLVWQEADLPWSGTTELGFRVMLARSSDGGQTWDPAVALSSRVGDAPTPKVAAFGANIGVAWLEDSEDGAEVRFVKVQCP